MKIELSKLYKQKLLLGKIDLLLHFITSVSTNKQRCFESLNFMHLYLTSKVSKSRATLNPKEAVIIQEQSLLFGYLFG